MSAHALVWWAILAGVLVIAILTGAQALRAVGELKKLARRVEDFEDLPVLKALDHVEADGRRIETAVDALPALLERAKAAVARIRRGPLPIELVAAIVRVRAEIAAFRKFSAR